MCKFAYFTHGRHMVCFTCRVTLKEVRTCPKCGDTMTDMGIHFKAPRQKDKHAWKIAHELHQHRLYFDGCCGGPGYGPRTKHELKKLLAEVGEERKSEGEKLLDKINRFAGKA